MREIKFRAFDKRDKLWIAGFTIPQSGVYSETDNIAVMQYTGLLDKNGKEIYEGDVVKGVIMYQQLLCGDSDDNCNVNMCGEVYYDHSGFALKCIQSMCDDERDGLVNYFDFIGSYGEIFREMEIIGNVHENGELINLDSK